MTGSLPSILGSWYGYVHGEVNGTLMEHFTDTTVKAKQMASHTHLQGEQLQSFGFVPPPTVSPLPLI